jgi:hypothetical protein
LLSGIEFPPWKPVQRSFDFLAGKSGFLMSRSCLRLKRVEWPFGAVNLTKLAVAMRPSSHGGDSWAMMRWRAGR